MSTVEPNSIRDQILAALVFSREDVRRSLLISDTIQKYDLIWKAYSQVEFAIGLAKLEYKDQIKSGIGSFHSLEDIQKRMRKTRYSVDKVNSYLNGSDLSLDRAITCFRAANAEEGLHEARKARDILKLLLLEEERAKGSKK